MQLVVESDAGAFAVLYERHTNVAFAGVSHVRKAGDRQKRSFRRVPVCGAVARAMTARAAACARGRLDRAQPRTTRRRGTVHDWEGSVTRASRSGWRPERIDGGFAETRRARSAAPEGLPVEQSHVMSWPLRRFTHSEITRCSIPDRHNQGRMRLGLQSCALSSARGHAEHPQISTSRTSAPSGPGRSARAASLIHRERTQSCRVLLRSSPRSPPTRWRWAVRVEAPGISAGPSHVGRRRGRAAARSGP
jgi:hypothetical protein